MRANAAGCLDQCARGVTVVVYPEQVWYGGVKVEDVARDRRGPSHRRCSGRTPADEVTARDTIARSFGRPVRPVHPPVAASHLDRAGRRALDDRAVRRARRSATPRLDAELLVAHVLSLPRVQLYVQFERVLAPDELAALRELIKRRQAGESVAYLTGRKEFWKLEFAVDARVLVPRPDTETLVEEALATRLGEPGGDAAAHRRRRHRLGRPGDHAGQAARRRGRVRERRLGGGAGGGARERRAARPRRSPSSRAIWPRRSPRTRRSR